MKLSRKKLNNKGFGHVELLLVAIFVVVLAGIGYYVWNHNKSTNTTHAGSWYDLSDNKGVDFNLVSSTGTSENISREDAQACVTSLSSGNYSLQYNVYREIKTPTIVALQAQITGKGLNPGLTITSSKIDRISLQFNDAMVTATPATIVNGRSVNPVSGGSGGWSNTGSGTQQYAHGSMVISKNTFKNGTFEPQFVQFASDSTNEPLGTNATVANDFGQTKDVSAYIALQAYYKSIKTTMPSYFTKTSVDSGYVYPYLNELQGGGGGGSSIQSVNFLLGGWATPVATPGFLTVRINTLPGC